MFLTEISEKKKTFEEKAKPETAVALLQIYCLSGEADENFLMAHPPSLHLREKKPQTGRLKIGGYQSSGLRVLLKLSVV